jgi:hypothetical protein
LAKVLAPVKTELQLGYFEDSGFEEIIGKGMWPGLRVLGGFGIDGLGERVALPFFAHKTREEWGTLGLRPKYDPEAKGGLPGRGHSTVG